MSAGAAAVASLFLLLLGTRHASYDHPGGEFGEGAGLVLIL